LAAGFGVLAVLLALLMSPFLGRAGAFLAALLMVFSPGFMYFNRFCREDTYYVTAVLAVVFFLLRYRRSRRPWDLWLASLALAVAYCTEEIFFFTFTLFASYLFIHWVSSALRKTLNRETSLAWKPDLLALGAAAGIFILVFILFFTSFFRAGTQFLQDGTIGALQCWLIQPQVHHGDYPPYYYLLQLLAYEPLCFLFPVSATVYYFFRPSKTLPRFLAYWFLCSYLLSSGWDKKPWYILDILLPAILLSGYFLGEMWDFLSSNRGLKGMRIALLLVAGLLFCYSGWTAVRLSFQNESNPAEPYVFVQTTPDCLEVERIVREIANGEGAGTNMPFTVDYGCSWPFAWLFRDFNQARFPTHINSTRDPVVLTGVDWEGEKYTRLKKAGYVNRRYKLRAWWDYSWFKKGYPAPYVDFSVIEDWLFHNGIPLKPHRDDMVGWGEIGKWVLNREVWSDEGSYDMRLWVRGDLAKKYGFTPNPSSAPATMAEN
jgi:uncharacterized protein (TIGR03663 family)